MVFIESVSLTNFKSYHHSRDIGPLLSTNAIVGPNGTGKSNILDAITFALGDVSKNLRVENLKDLIYTSSDGQTEKFCSVCIRLTLPADKKTHEFERRLRSNGTSEFFVNKRKEIKDEYIRILESHGIFAKYDNFVIRQGTINRMIQDGDANRTKFIDVVSGSSGLDEKCKEYQKSYESLLNNLKAHQEATQQNNSDLHRLSVAHGKRKDIEDDMKNLADTRTDYYLLQMYPLEKKLETMETKFQNQKAKLEKDLKPDDELNDALEQKQIVFNEYLAESKQLMAKKQKLEAEEATAKSHMNAANEKITFLEGKVATSEKMVKALNAKSQEKHDDKKEIERKISDLENEIKALEGEYRRKSQSGVAEGELAKFFELQKVVDDNDVSEQLKAHEEKLEMLQKELESFKNTLQLEEERLKIKQRELSLLETCDPEHDRLEKLKSQASEVEQEIEKIESDIAKKAEYTKEFEEVQNQLADQEITSENNRKEDVRNQIEKELTSKFPGQVYGILSKLCTPIDESYTLAVTTVFQKWKNAFIVDSDETGARCIEVLKEQKRRRQKFIPIDQSLTIRNVPTDIQKIIDSGKAKFIREFVTLRHDNPEIGRALDFVCGTILFCETPEEASEVAYNQGKRYTVVSMNGTMFHKNGKVTGGARALMQQGDPFNPSQGQQLLQRKSDLISLLRDIPRSDEGALTAKQSRLNHLQELIEKSEKQRPALAKERGQRIEQVKRVIREIEAVLTEKRGMFDLTQSKIQETESEIQKLQIKKEELIKNTFAEFCKRNKIRDIRAFHAEDVQLQKQFAEKKNQLSNEIQKLNNELQYVTDSRTEESERAKERLETAKADLENLRETWRNVQRECTNKHDLFLRAIGELERHDEYLESAGVELKQLKDQKKKNKEIKAKLAKISKENESNHDYLINETQRIIFECRVKQIALPLINGNFENIELFESSQSTSSSGSSPISLTEFKADYSKLDAVKDQLEKEDQRKVLIERKLKEINELEKQITIKEAGSVSVEDYNKRIEKAREEDNQNMAKFSELSKNLTEWKRKLEDVKNERKSLFMTMFKKMQKDVDYYYKLLYSDSTAQAYLSFMGTDEPYNSKILFDLIVPGKRRASIDLLSGGEKAMAIFAYLFAGKSAQVNCVLMDEFDEALDPRNMRLISKFINVLSSRGIQFLFISHRVELYAYANRLLGSAAHCASSCEYGSIIYTVDVRDYIEDETTRRNQYNPDDENEDMRKQAKIKIEKALTIMKQEAPSDEVIETEFDKFMNVYASQDVGDFLKEFESADGSQKCHNNSDARELGELFTQLCFDE